MLKSSETNNLRVVIMFQSHMSINRGGCGLFIKWLHMVPNAYAKWSFGFSDIKASTAASCQMHYSYSLARDCMFNFVDMAIGKRGFSRVIYKFTYVTISAWKRAESSQSRRRIRRMVTGF